MTSPIETVTAFLNAWGRSADDFRTALRTYFTAETVWDNVGIAKTTGVEDALKFFEEFAAKAGFATFSAELIHIAASGNAVLTERVDRAILPNGKLVRAGLRVMGAFEIRDGKIVAWRDYVDAAALKKH
jgi:limonene-1,2-epoxide hydrolase